MHSWILDIYPGFFSPQRSNSTVGLTVTRLELPEPALAARISFRLPHLILTDIAVFSLYTVQVERVGVGSCIRGSAILRRIPINPVPLLTNQMGPARDSHAVEVKLVYMRWRFIGVLGFNENFP